MTTKVKTALKTLGEAIYEPIEVRNGNEKEVRNKYAFLQNQVLQGIAWKLNQQIDNIEDRLRPVRDEAKSLAETPMNEIDEQRAARIINQAEFWGGQETICTSLMDDVQSALKFFGHEEYKMRDTRSRASSGQVQSAPDKDEIKTKMKALFDLNVTEANTKGAGE